ncbi:cupin domain-containing protein [Archangium gephyra]|uniref:cupin-like domain-containing protein n=1 Tax=Archangium gephyra TaxID=48 RepID=UPI0035D4D1C8
MSFRLPVGFWKTFAAETWDQQPRVFKNLFDGRLLIPTEELFRVVADEQAQYAQVAGDWMKPRISRLIIDKGEVVLRLPYMPRHEDGSFEGWTQRLYKELPGRGFLFHMQRLQSRSRLMFDRYRQFTDGLFEQIGLPSYRVDADMFAGDYSETFFGVHKDLAGNFAIILTGRKRMLLWPYETLLPYVTGNLDPSNLDFTLQLRSMKEIREPPIVLDGEPGDVFYWPGRFWHCAQGNGALSITTNLAVYHTSNPLADSFPEKVFEVLGPAISDSMAPTPFEPARRQELASAVPETLRGATAHVVEGLRKLVEGGFFEREMELTWLRYVSGGGYTIVHPPATGVVLDDSQAMKLLPEAGLVWRKLSSGEIGVSSNGLSECFPESRGLVETLHRLAGGGAHRVGALLEEVVEERQGDKVVWSREHLRALLTTLASQHALVRA